MAIMLVPDEIPKYWEAIKFAAVNFDLVEEQYRAKYLNRLLYLLLAGKAQCFVRLSAERKLQMIGITKILTDEIRDERTLFAVGLYSFEKVPDEVWKEDVEALKGYAKMNDCKTVTTWSINKKAVYLLELVGFKRRFKAMVLDLSGGV